MTEIEKIVAIAKEVDIMDPIDWDEINLNQDETYRLIAFSIIEEFNRYNMDERQIMIATITKLVVENFVLNLKLQLQQGK